jgi:Rrf2 family protein
MQFTKAEEYGMFGVLYLADADKTKVIPLSEISQAQDIPEKFLAKIFQSLSKAGIVRSHRGVRGGFTLAKSPDQISIKEVLETIQGPYRLMKCTESIAACDRNNGDFCALREVLVIAEHKLVSVFDQFTLADLANWQNTQTKPEKSALTRL